MPERSGALRGEKSPEEEEISVDELLDELEFLFPKETPREEREAFLQFLPLLWASLAEKISHQIINNMVPLPYRVLKVLKVMIMLLPQLPETEREEEASPGEKLKGEKEIKRWWA